MDLEVSEVLKVPDEPPAAAAAHPHSQASKGDAVDAGKEVVSESTYTTTDPTVANSRPCLSSLDVSLTSSGGDTSAQLSD